MGLLSCLAAKAKALAGRRQAPLTPLGQAAREGDLVKIKLLLRRAADVNERESLSGLSPLASAARHKDLACLRELLQAGADLDFRDEQGLGLVARAGAIGSRKTARHLMRLGAPLPDGSELAILDAMAGSPRQRQILLGLRADMAHHEARLLRASSDNAPKAPKAKSPRL